MVKLIRKQGVLVKNYPQRNINEVNTANGAHKKLTINFDRTITKVSSRSKDNTN